MLYVLRSAIARRESLGTLRSRPELRKATEQMLWAYAAAVRCLENLDARESLGLVVGSGQGELETTKNFYKSLARENIARPFLFQNSLHHSTTGMLSQALQIKGAAATVSDHFFSGESALELAASLLESRQCGLCLVVGVDTLVPEFDSGVRARYPKDMEIGEGSAALLVAGTEGWKQMGSRSEFSIESFRLDRETKQDAADFRGYYDSDAIERLIKHRDSPSIRLSKPDGSASHFTLRGYG
jgi:hypothetical protein